MRILLVSLALVAGCGKDSTKPAASDDPGLAFVAKEVRKDLAAAKAALATGTPDKALLECAQLDNPDVERADPTLAKEYRQVCGHDFPIATMKLEVEKAEAARKAKPTDTVLVECFDAYYELAVKTLAEHKTEDDASKALAARWTAACPDAKK